MNMEEIQQKNITLSERLFGFIDNQIQNQSGIEEWNYDNETSGLNAQNFLNINGNNDTINNNNQSDRVNSSLLIQSEKSPHNIYNNISMNGNGRYPNPIFFNLTEINTMSDNTRNCVIAYVILFCIGAPGNLSIFISLGREIYKRNQLIRSRIKVLIWHLATADLLVTFLVIPIEIFWRLNIQWHGGNFFCKICQFFRAFGLYLSSMVIICISLDRFFAIIFPMKVIVGMRRVRNMLIVAWITAIIFAAPQSLFFSLQPHPIYRSIMVCANFNAFNSLEEEIAYNMFAVIAMYFAPLLVIIITYAMVLYKIARKAKEHHQNSREGNGSHNLRRSDNAMNITRARRRTLILSMVIVTAFVFCWTPYVAMTLWYMFDFENANKLVDPRVQEALFITAVSNSTLLNPIIYGNYMKKYWRSIKYALHCSSSNTNISRGSSRIRRPNRNTRDTSDTTM